VVHCSFCAKEDSAVAKVIAGPGVYICNECVGLCNAILEEDAVSPGPPKLPMWEDMTDEQMLAHIPRIAVVESQVEGSLQEWVQQLRRRGVTWERIGSALGMARQSAWERFSGER
jgi:hypothetical protein